MTDSKENCSKRLKCWCYGVIFATLFITHYLLLIILTNYPRLTFSLNFSRNFISLYENRTCESPGLLRLSYLLELLQHLFSCIVEIYGLIKSTYLHKDLLHSTLLDYI